jgi:hypothetical protein
MDCGLLYRTGIRPNYGRGNAGGARLIKSYLSVVVDISMRDILRIGRGVKVNYGIVSGANGLFSVIQSFFI